MGEAASWSPGGLRKAFRVGKLKLVFQTLTDFFQNSISLLKDFHPSPACPSDKCSRKMKLSMEHLWNDTGNGKSKNLERNMSQRHLVHQKSHVEWSEVEFGPPRFKPEVRLSNI